MTNRKNRRPLGKVRDRASTQKISPAVRGLIKELDLEGRKYKKSVGGLRNQVYASMQTAQRVIAECLKNVSTHSGFVHAVQRKKEIARSRSFNLSLEAIPATLQLQVKSALSERVASTGCFRFKLTTGGFSIGPLDAKRSDLGPEQEWHEKTPG